MILISAGLVLAAVILLIAGFVLAKAYLIMWSIVVSVLSALFLVIGAFLRRHEEEDILVVANLSRFVQYVELDLSAFHGKVAVELFGGTRFPPIGELPYLLTLGAYGFYWFRLPAAEVDRNLPAAPEPVTEEATVL